jgi:hypothetical protein
MIQNRKHIIYEGVREGQYVRQNGKFVLLSKINNIKK